MKNSKTQLFKNPLCHKTGANKIPWKSRRREISSILKSRNEKDRTRKIPLNYILKDKVDLLLLRLALGGKEPPDGETVKAGCVGLRACSRTRDLSFVYPVLKQEELGEKGAFLTHSLSRELACWKPPSCYWLDPTNAYLFPKHVNFCQEFG